MVLNKPRDDRFFLLIEKDKTILQYFISSFIRAVFHLKWS